MFSPLGLLEVVDMSVNLGKVGFKLELLLFNHFFTFISIMSFYFFVHHYFFNIQSLL